MRKPHQLAPHHDNDILELTEADANGISSSYNSGYGFGGNANQHVINLRDYWRAIGKHFWWILGFTLLVTALVTVYVAQKPDYYTATARVQVNNDSNPALSGREGNSIFVNTDTDPSYFSTQLQILEGSGLLRRVVKTLDLENNEAFFRPYREKRTVWQNVRRMFGFDKKPLVRPSQLVAVEETTSSHLDKTAAEVTDKVFDEREAEQLAPYVAALRGNLKISPVKENRVMYKETRLIDIRFTHPDPEVAAKVANAIADAYLLNNLEKKVTANNSAGDFLQKRVAKLQAEIRNGEERLMNYARSRQIVSLDPSQNTVVQKLGTLNSQLAQAEADRISAEAAYRAGLAPGVADARIAENDTRAAQLETRISDLKQQREQLSVKFTSRWPQVIELDRQIAALQQEVGGSHTRAVSTFAVNLESKYREAFAREQELRRNFNQQRAEVLSQNEAAIYYRIIQQEVDTNKTLLDGLLQRSRENEVVLNGTPNNVLLVDRALTPNFPVGPRRFEYIVIGGFLAACFGIALAWFFQFIDNTVRTAEDVINALRLPFIAAIPSAKTASRRNLSAATSLSLTRPEPVRSERVVISATSSNPVMTEAYMHLRTALLLSAAGGPPKSLLITSSNAGEGKTTTAINLAMALAQTEARVLLIDCDLRCPTLHGIFNMPNNYGLTNLLAEKQPDESKPIKAVTPCDDNLYVLPAGTPTPNPPNLIGSEQMRRLIGIYEAHFDYVVIDSPPTNLFTDSALLSSLTDSVLLIVRSGKTTRDAVLRANRLLQDVGANIFGVVLNDTPACTNDYAAYDNYYSLASFKAA